METEPSKSVAISYSDLRDAYEFVSSGRKFESEAYICTNTGSIYLSSDMAGIDEMPEDAEESDAYIGVPHKNDLDLGRDLAFAFVDEHVPDRSTDVRDIFHSRGAYRRFKHMLESRGMLEKWYAYEESATQEALRAWCETVGIQLTDPPKSTDTG